MIRKLMLILTISLLLLVSASGSALAAPIAGSPQTGAYYDNTDNIWDYTLCHQVIVSNNTEKTINNVVVELPLLDKDYPLYCQIYGMELSPYPREIRLDELGQRIASYNLGQLKPGSSITLTQKYALAVYNTRYQIPSSDSSYTQSELNQYAGYLYLGDLQNSKGQQVISFATQAAQGATNPYDTAKALFSAVNLALDYDSSQQEQDAASVFARGSGDCQGYTNLLLAALRSQGIPSRAVSGYLYQPEAAEPDIVQLNPLRHTWVEFYLPALGWVIADPTFTYTYQVNGNNYKFIDWSYFANADSSRRYIFYSYGDPNEEQIVIRSTGSAEPDIQFTATLKPGKDYLPFADIAGHWGKEAIIYNVEQGYFNGVSSTAFAPNTQMTRAMFITVLSRLYLQLGQDMQYYPGVLQAFRDIDSQGYYIQALGWGVSHGIIDGYGNGRFGPNDPITRQQMTKIIVKFLELLEEEGLYTIADSQQVPDFADWDKVSPWAWPGVQLCTASGLIAGYEDNTFRPAALASRAEVAVILQRLDNQLR